MESERSTELSGSDLGLAHDSVVATLSFGGIPDTDKPTLSCDPGDSTARSTHRTSVCACVRNGGGGVLLMCP